MECPICMLNFEGNDKVYGLKCSNLHLYHQECLNDQLNARDDKCALCRKRIDVDYL